MHIQFERSGGFAGMRFEATIETDSLSPEESQELGELVEACGFFDLPPVIHATSTAPDSFQYRVTIQEENRAHTVETGDAAAPDALRPLLRRLTVLARRAKK